MLLVLSKDIAGHLQDTLEPKTPILHDLHLSCTQGQSPDAPSCPSWFHLTSALSTFFM